MTEMCVCVCVTLEFPVFLFIQLVINHMAKYLLEGYKKGFEDLRTLSRRIETEQAEGFSA